MPAPGRERFGRYCDTVVNGGVVLLLLFSPLAFGSVHAWSLALVELLSAALIVVWAVKLLACGNTAEARGRLRRWGAPLAGFGVVAALQLVPLPPPLLRVISPSTYAVYQDNLPGWPRQEAFADLARAVDSLRRSPARPPQLGPLPSVSASDAVALPALAPQVGRAEALARQIPAPGRWRSFSVYRYRSGQELVRMLALSAVFFCSSAIRGSPRL